MPRNSPAAELFDLSSMEHERDWDSSAFRTTENVYFRAWHGDQIEERVKQPRSKLLSEQETVKTEKHWKQSKTKWRFVHWLSTDWKDKRSENLHYRQIWENIIAMPQGKSDLQVESRSGCQDNSIPGSAHCITLCSFGSVHAVADLEMVEIGEIKSISDLEQIRLAVLLLGWIWWIRLIRLFGGFTEAERRETTTSTEGHVTCSQHSVAACQEIKTM